MSLEILLVIKGIHVRLKRNRESVYEEWFSQVREENLGNIKQRLMITLCTEKAVGLGVTHTRRRETWPCGTSKPANGSAGRPQGSRALECPSYV